MQIAIKRFLQVITVVLTTVTLIGCVAEETASDKLKDLDFTVVGEGEQPDALKDIIAEKLNSAFQISYTIGEELYIAIGYGEQPSGGYSITVNQFYETPNSLFIDTTLLGPGSAENVTNTPTTPYIVIKTENIADKPIEFK